MILIFPIEKIESNISVSNNNVTISKLNINDNLTTMVHQISHVKDID